jgi:hypothetical protein
MPIAPGSVGSSRGRLRAPTALQRSSPRPTSRSSRYVGPQRSRIVERESTPTTGGQEDQAPDLGTPRAYRGDPADCSRGSPGVRVPVATHEGPAHTGRLRAPTLATTLVLYKGFFPDRSSTRPTTIKIGCRKEGSGVAYSH